MLDLGVGVGVGLGNAIAIGVGLWIVMRLGRWIISTDEVLQKDL